MTVGKSYEQPRFSITGISGADLSAKRYRAVYMDSAAVIQVAGVNQPAIGVLQTPEIAGVPVNIMVSGISFIEYGDTVVAGTNITSDSVGRGIPSVGTAPVVGIALCSGVVGEIGCVLLAGKTGVVTTNKSILSIPVTLSKLADGDIVTSFVPGFAGTITKMQLVVTDPVTTAEKLATLNLEIGSTNVTGGVLSLTSANCTPLGATIAATAITAANAFTATDLISVEAASVTAFVEGTGVLLITLG